ncbi:MAG: tetratricopeptide repeat protein [Spirochaetota bacterium]
MRTHGGLVLIVLLALVVPVAWPQVSPGITFGVAPRVTIPVGPSLGNGTGLYTTGGGVSVDAQYPLPWIPSLFVGGRIGVELAPLNALESAMSLIDLSPTIGAQLKVSERVRLSASGHLGMYQAMSRFGNVRNPFWDTALGAGYAVSPSITLGVQGSYREYLIPEGRLHQGVQVATVARFTTGAAARGKAVDVEYRVEPVFPAFYTYYDVHPLGEASLLNNESDPIRDVSVWFFAPQLMDNPRLCAEATQVRSGRQLSVPLHALFNEEILAITEGTAIAGEIRLEYSYLDRPTEKAIPVTVEVHPRNALTWDDDRKVAAFVASRDPLVMSLGKTVAGFVRDAPDTAVNANFRTAVALLQALQTHGLSYVVDPVTPHAAVSLNEQAIDHVQFPGQTLAFNAGDCDDLSVLYAALLETVGIPAAMVTTPGHIFVAFGLGMGEDAVDGLFLDDGAVIRDDGQTWVPVEVTLVREGFAAAWSRGVRNWSDADAAGEAALYPVREAWGLYRAVGFSGYDAPASLPAAPEIRESYEREMQRLITAQIQPRVSDLRRRIDAAPDRLDLRNRLGVLYARFGLLEDAETELRYLANRGYVPGTVNLGNVRYLRGALQDALVAFRSALENAPEDPNALAGVVRVHRALGNGAEAEAAIARLESVEPGMVERIGGVGRVGGASDRASSSEEREVYSWAHE